MSSITNARQAIKIAKEVIAEAGYKIASISNVEHNEDDGTWNVTAISGDIEITIEIDEENGEVTDFSTEY